MPAIDGCDPTWCTWTFGGGPNGGDLCSCTIPAADHPTRNYVGPSCGQWATGTGIDLAFNFDLTGYNSFSASTCVGTRADSVLAVYTDDPTLGGDEAYCNSVAIGEADSCAKLWDPEQTGADALLVNVPTGSQRAWFVVDELIPQLYWNGSADRRIDFEFSSQVVSTCGNGRTEPGEGCDDGNRFGGDGCSRTCELEPTILQGCDPAWCTLTMGDGPNGGDLCTCAIPGSAHPTTNAVEASCFSGAPGNELVFAFDLDATGYVGYSVDTCALIDRAANSNDASVAIYDDDPRGIGVEVACNEDAIGEEGLWCPKLADPQREGFPAGPMEAPATGEIFVVVDEWAPQAPYAYWDGETTRRFSIELLTVIPVCGDRVIEGGETCDDGNRLNGDGCDVDCYLEPVCGNGTVELPETCDDGNTDPGDGCDSDCRREPRCGDGNVDAGEQCDDGNRTGGDGCSPTCTREGFCGDGNRDLGEECDDGNNSPGDGCDPNCYIESALTLVGCDPSFCVWETAAGPNLGDLCTCTIPGAFHPTADVVDPTCIGGERGYTPELVFQFDVSSYASFAVDSCNDPSVDGALMVVGAYYEDPAGALAPSVCGGPAQNEADQCVRFFDPGVGGMPAAPVGLRNGASTLWLSLESLDNFGPPYWDRFSNRTIQFEFTDQVVATCGNSLVEPGEQCDDGNLFDGDGCNGWCEWDVDILQGCDPRYCNLDGGGGPNGGDLCTCTIPGFAHPTLDLLEPSCASSGPGGSELLLQFDMMAAGYDAFAIDTCSDDFFNLPSTTVGVYDWNPLVGGGEYLCSDGSTGLFPTACGRVGEGGGGFPNPPSLEPMPPTGVIYVAIGEDDLGVYWDGVTDRSFSVELLGPGYQGACPNGILEPFNGEECDDNNSVNGDGCDQFCQREPVCGDGYVDWPETCDDQNFDPNDGCDDCTLVGGLTPWDEGQILITEFQTWPLDPQVDFGGTWIEVFNTTAEDLDLLGCDLFLPYDGFQIPVSVIVPGGGHATIAETHVVGFEADFVAEDFGLGMGMGPENGNIELVCNGGMLIDLIWWDLGANDFPNVDWASTQLNPDFLGFFENDSPSAWCPSAVMGPYYYPPGGQLGTPGYFNEPCEGAGPEDCQDGVDNDFDGFADCNDPECWGFPGCQEICSNGIDDNGNGQTDCADAQCNCTGTEFCGDGADNDGDGLIDCIDSDCITHPSCAEDCTNGLDDNGNSSVDCADAYCVREPQCLEDCGNGVDDNGDGHVDCEDPTCGIDPSCGRLILEGCDPAFCTLDLSSGPNGGDVCTCTVPPSMHPTTGVAEAYCFGGSVGRDLTIRLDVSMGYNEFSVSTCLGDISEISDSALAVFDADPALGIDAIACNEDAAFEPNWCAELPDSQASGPPLPMAMPASGEAWILVDEYGLANYWGENPAYGIVATNRTIVIELLNTVPPSVCGNGTVEPPFEACDDGNVAPGDGCDDVCQWEPLAPRPGAAGDVLITELMPWGFSAWGPWVELKNPRGTDLDLLDCRLRAPGGEAIFTAPFVVGAGETVVIAGQEAAVDADLRIADFPNYRAFESLVILCPSGFIDQVDFDLGNTWPGAVGASVQLAPVATDPILNDLAVNWCLPNAVGARSLGGELGSPGEANPPCPAAAPEICDDQLDNDLDQLLDCNDPDCAALPICIEDCTNDVDDDRNGLVDCDDPDCEYDFACYEDCTNAADDNLDGLVDCDDPLCSGDPTCAVPVFNGCDPKWCTTGVADGPNGGDTCTCTLPAGYHPYANRVEGSCFGGRQGADLTVGIDLFQAGYSGYSIDTCVGAPGDSSLAVFGADPTLGGNELACNEDVDELTFCAQLGNDGSGVPVPSTAPAGGRIWVTIDEWHRRDYWDGVTDRTFTIELLRSGSCGNGRVEVAEQCDDGNLVGGDGCDGFCQTEVMGVYDCDAQFCSLGGTGPNGGELCTCTFPGPDHPTTNGYEASCFEGTEGNELVFLMSTEGYQRFTVSTCGGTGGDSSLAAFVGNPDTGTEIACNEDAFGEASWCSKLADPGGGGDPAPVSTGGAAEVQIVVDEWILGGFWDGIQTRTVQIELF